MKINLDNALEFLDGDLELLKEVVQDVFEELPEKLTELKDSVQKLDALKIASGAHYLKSSLGAIGAESAFSLAQQLEMTGRTHALTEASQVFDRLDFELNQLKRFFATPDWELHV